MVQRQDNIHLQNNDIKALLHDRCKKTKSLWIKDLNIKVKNLNHFEYYIGINIDDVRFDVRLV